MDSDQKNSRERVRELVRDILRSMPVDAEPESEFKPEHVIVNSMRDRLNRPYDRDESAKSLITEDDLRGLEAGSRVRVATTVKFTPLAMDIVAERSIELIYKESRDAGLTVKSVAIGADHGGFEVKEKLKVFLSGLGVNVRDFGTDSTDAVDYPDFAHAVARAVGAKHVDAGILIDGAGIGSAMAANKVPGVRAAACYSPALAKNSREHNGANVLTLGSGQNSYDEIEDIVTVFLSNILTEDRHRNRVGKIDAIDKEYRR
jgi:ribose 5-phosphate isomerase B